MYFPSILLALFLAITSTNAVWNRVKDVCYYNCEEALYYAVWTDVSPTEDYYKAVCTDNLLVRSALLCGKFYCDKQQQEDGYKYWNEGVCQQYSPYTLISRSVIANYTMEDIRNLPRITVQDYLDGVEHDTEAIPAQDFYDLSYKTVYQFAYQLELHHDYGWAMYGFWGAVIVISMFYKLLAYLIRRSTASTRVDAEQGTPVANKGTLWKYWNSTMTYLSTSATFGTKCTEPVFWCTVPPLIESLTIFAFVAINVVLCSVNYHAFPDNIYWPDKSVQIWRYISDRTGIICFANLPLLWIFGSRNNILLWMTGWSFGTFNAFHRWVARVATVQAILHSIGYTAGEIILGYEYYVAEWEETYWWTGAVATVCMSLMLGFSVWGLRRFFYEFFLITHIVLALVTLVTLFYHVDVLINDYDGYLWAVVAIWCFDRFLRIARVVLLNGKFLTGSKSATAWYSTTSETIYLDVPTSINIKYGAGTSYYVYLLHGWKFWESHPFTAISVLDSSEKSATSSQDGNATEKGVQLKAAEKANSTLSLQPNKVGFAIRPYGGFTKRLRNLLEDTRPGEPKPIRVLLEGPYGHAAGIKNFDNNLLIIGGSGITAALSHLESTVLVSGSKPPSIRLHWSVRHIAAFEEYRDELAALCRTLNTKLTVYVTREPKDEVDKVKAEENIYPSGWSVQYGRMNISDVMREESDDSLGSTAVVGCGPARMMDETRSLVVQYACKESRDIHYYQETFGW